MTSSLAEHIRVRDHVEETLDTGKSGVKVPHMPLTPEELAKEALDLPTESRALLADLIVESLDTAELGPIDQAWVAEAKRRRDDVRAGRVRTISASEGFKQVRDALKR
jgi:hypothetical protein